MSRHSVEALLDRFRNGERGALARLLSVVENRPERSDEIVDSIFPSTGHAHVVGVTGPPGAGKSTLVNKLVLATRKRGKGVAVLAIDPSSAVTGGAALGDRIRMLDTWEDDGVYVRSMAARGQLGGLASGVFGAIHLLDAFGFDVIYVETVGVGQAEVDIASVADTTILVQVPGLGDTVQLIKAGVLEIADLLVVNKADQPGANQLLRDIRNTVDHTIDGWNVPILATSSLEEQGIDELLDAIADHREHLDRADSGQARVRRITAELRQIVVAGLAADVDALIESPTGVEIVAAVKNRERGPRAAARMLSHCLLKSPESSDRADPPR